MTDLAKSSAWISDPVSPRQGGRWDLLVIGGGTAGLVAAKAAAGFGATVLLVEKDRSGGDCLWTGCVPSKTLLSAARTAAQVRRADRYGVTVTGVEVWVLTALPERLLVLGGGSIGGELGQAFARLGSSVSIVEAAATLLVGEGPDAAALVTAALTADVVSVRTGVLVQKVSTADQGWCAELADGSAVARPTCAPAPPWCPGAPASSRIRRVESRPTTS